MAWKTVRYRWTSAPSCPLIMHNGQTADPTNKWSRLIKKISSKRNKTDADYEEMARLEFMAGLYLHKTEGPIIPNYVIDSVILHAARKSREGKTTEAGCFCTDHARLEYDGPRTAEELWDNEDFRFSRLVRVQRARIARMRPKFDKWSAVITLDYEDTLVDVETIDKWMIAAGTQVGVGNWRPQNGRFTAERLNGK